MSISYFPVSWNEYHTLARKLSAGILSSGSQFDKIVAISRGGLTLGHLLTDFLRIPISTLAIQSYNDIQKQGVVKIIDTFKASIKGQNIILVDDISESGKTFKRAVLYLAKLQPKSITTVAMFYKPWSGFRPDYFAKQVKKWVIFPYELTETVLSISKKMQKQGKTKAQIQALLEKLNFSKEEIAFVRKHYL